MKRLFGLMSLVMLVLLAAPSSYAVPILFFAHLDGPSENPSNASPGTGFAQVVLDTAAHTLSVEATFSGLLGNTIAAHIHCCVAPPGNAGVVVPAGPTFASLPLGVTSGTVSELLDTTQASTFRPAFITANGGTPAGAEAALLAGLQAGEAYFNIHTLIPGSSPPMFPGGEIRGFLVTPEPGTFGLLAVGIAALGVAVRRRRG